MFKFILFSLLVLSASCGTYRSSIGPFVNTAQACDLTDDEAGYDQAAYDECMDSDDTTPEQCESI